MKTRPQYFIRKNQSEGPVIKPNIWFKMAGFSLALVLFISIVAYAGWHVKSVYTKVSASWNEIQFAYEKPSVVKAARAEYEDKTKALDIAVAERKKRDQQFLIDEAVKRLRITPTGQK